VEAVNALAGLSLFDLGLFGEGGILEYEIAGDCGSHAFGSPVGWIVVEERARALSGDGEDETRKE